MVILILDFIILSFVYLSFMVLVALVDSKFDSHAILLELDSLRSHVKLTNN